MAGHFFVGKNKNDPGYMWRLNFAQNMSAVTGACMLMRREIWDTLGGLNENYAVAFNDADLCMRIRNAGWLIVWTPFAKLYHFESKSRGEEDTPEKERRFNDEVCYFKKCWAKELETGDPYYNPNLSLTFPDFCPVDIRPHDAR